MIYITALLIITGVAAIIISNKTIAHIERTRIAIEGGQR